MKNATILTVLGPKSSVQNLTSTIDMARGANAHLAFMVAAAVAQFPAYRIGIPPYGSVYVPGDWEEAVATAREQLDEKKAELHALLRAEAVSGDVTVISCEPPLIADAVAERAKLCDFAQIASDLRSDKLVFRNALYGLLFKSPVGTVLNGPIRPKFKKVFVAWNTSLPSASAVQQALPILIAADEVTIASFDPVMMPSQDGENPGSDVAKWLSHHGCKVAVQQYPSGGQDIGDAILSRAGELGADLIVAGGYGHSKLRQNIFGGTSQILIAQTEVPVFLAH